MAYQICENCAKRLAVMKNMPYPTPDNHFYWPGPEFRAQLCEACRGTVDAVLAATGERDLGHVFLSLFADGRPPIHLSCRQCGRMSHPEGGGQGCDRTYLDLANQGEIQVS